MTTPRKLVVAFVVAVLLSLAPVSAAHAKAYVGSKNSTYVGGGQYPGALFDGTVTIKVGKDNKVLNKVAITYFCPEGDGKVVWTKLRYKPDFNRFDAIKGTKAKPTYELFVSFGTKKAASGDLWIHTGPCKGHRLGFVAERQ
jgi:hypothetical protein